MDINHYIEKFNHLNVSLSNGVAPHKPIMLLAVMENIEKGLITDNHIIITPELIETFQKTWKKYVPELSVHKPTFEKPFFHLKNDGFWELINFPGEQIPITGSNSVTSLGALKKAVKWAQIDLELFNLLKDDSSKKTLRETLLRTYFSTNNMTESWTDIEVTLIVNDYFSMLTDELNGKPLNKAQHRKTLLPLLNGRSEGSIEFKHQNISAILRDIGAPWIKGYKPRSNYQKSLAEEVLEYLIANPKIENIFISFSDNVSANTLLTFNNFDSVIETGPEPNLVADLPISTLRKPFKINYLEREQNNILLGSSGEQFVINYEKWRLQKASRNALADTVEWISKTDDGAGFDILFRNENGTDRYIEVKTTKLSKETPIFFSRTEYRVSQEKSSNYHLYRLFNFAQEPKMFLKHGKFDDFCIIEAVQYKGYF